MTLFQLLVLVIDAIAVAVILIAIARELAALWRHPQRETKRR